MQIEICEDEDNWQVWLNPDKSRYNGLCIGEGPTKNEALADAVVGLEQTLDFLQSGNA